MIAQIILLILLILIIYHIRDIITHYHDKKNFAFRFFNKEFWYSRSVAVVTFVFGYDKNGKKYILANQRGKGTPDYRHLWNVPCGYLDFNESGEEAAKRETFEETNVNLDVSKIHFITASTSPKNNRQNVSLRYRYDMETNIEDIKLTSDNSEENEVENIKWIPIDEIDNYQWAFEHDKIIKTLI